MVKELVERNSLDFFGEQIELDGDPIRLNGGKQNAVYRIKVKGDDKEYAVKVFSESKYPDNASLEEAVKNEIFADSLKAKGCSAISAITSKTDGSRLLYHTGLRCMVYPFINGQIAPHNIEAEQLKALTNEFAKILKHSEIVTEYEVERYDFSKFEDLIQNFISSKKTNLSERDFHIAKKFIERFNQLSDSQKVATLYTNPEVNKYNCIFTSEADGTLKANIVDWEDCYEVSAFKVFLRYALTCSGLLDENRKDIDFEKFKTISEAFFKEYSLNQEEFEFAFISSVASFADWLQQNLEKAISYECSDDERERSVKLCMETVPVFDKFERCKTQVKLIIDRCIEAQRSHSSSLTV